MPVENRLANRRGGSKNVGVTFEIRRVGYDHPDAQALVAEVQQMYAERYGSIDTDPTDPVMFVPPAGAFFVGYLGGVPAATGGWRASDERLPGASRVAEIKRMYVVARHQRRGLARRMLAHLEADARATGIDGLILSTGQRQPEAIALYLSSGYCEIAPFGYYADEELVRCFGKRLGAPAPSSL